MQVCFVARLSQRRSASEECGQVRVDKAENKESFRLCRWLQCNGMSSCCAVDRLDSPQSLELSDASQAGLRGRSLVARTKNSASGTDAMYLAVRRRNTLVRPKLMCLRPSRHHYRWGSFNLVLYGASSKVMMALTMICTMDSRTGFNFP